MSGRRPSTEKGEKEMELMIGFFLGGMTVALSARYVLNRFPRNIAEELSSRKG
jgi:hypothetical protein